MTDSPKWVAFGGGPPPTSPNLVSVVVVSLSGASCVCWPCVRGFLDVFRIFLCAGDRHCHCPSTSGSLRTAGSTQHSWTFPAHGHGRPMLGPDCEPAWSMTDCGWAPQQCQARLLPGWGLCLSLVLARLAASVFGKLSHWMDGCGALSRICGVSTAGHSKQFPVIFRFLTFLHVPRFGKFQKLRFTMPAHVFEPWDWGWFPWISIALPFCCWGTKPFHGDVEDCARLTNRGWHFSEAASRTSGLLKSRVDAQSWRGAQFCISRLAT